MEEGGDLEDFAALDERLAKLFALPDAQAPETLQVMTIHKSKGLEFDTVIVPGLGYRTGRDDPQLLQWLERPNAAGGSDLLLGALTEQGRDEDPVYRCVTRLHKERQRQEDGRLLYVAVTRARQRVHLIGHAELDEKTATAKEPDDSTLLARLWPVLAPDFDSAARHLLQDAAAARPASVPNEHLCRACRDSLSPRGRGRAGARSRGPAARGCDRRGARSPRPAGP